MGAAMTSPEANWYLDPQDPKQLRYWDGQQWTDHRAPLPPPEPQQHAERVDPLSAVAGGALDPANVEVEPTKKEGSKQVSAGTRRQLGRTCASES